ncbi:homoserine O-succinyltransferase [Thalassotalea sp. LPB0316]|uniref:homoserine O-acetyltransferase MetA n=1 Tax=Thalassotalea sp. LPB0316 TaxID=2769490 RepID=UPI0018685223|nr:homoserine O-succinyltransferase [Thalassotalea sp. LPB0316]QOL25536.1 homoserine O-succinyltransferase [Thalassotalea sp. LPB0316]
MPIKIPDQLPALNILGNENIFVMSEHRAVNQEIRPMEVAILNLMPNKIETEVQILRMLSNTPLQINIELVRIHKNPSKNTPTSHLESFYRLFDDIKHKHYDGLIITGAPLGLIDYEEVSYWDKICEVFDWAQQHVVSTMYLCWAAHAALYHHYGIDRKLRDEKLSGVYDHQVLAPLEKLTRGFDDEFKVPHSRYAQVTEQDYQSINGLNILAQSDEAGVYLVASEDKRQVFVTGHPEYDAHTLAQEYQRDVTMGLEPTVPVNYFKGDDPDNEPRSSWRSHGSLLFNNWINYYVYQITPYQLDAEHIQTSITGE